MKRYLAISALSLLLFTGCAAMTSSEKGMTMGAITGAGAGAIVGGIVAPGFGALPGAVVGAAGGAAIGAVAGAETAPPVHRHYYDHE
jgi:hypothetical protein